MLLTEATRVHRVEFVLRLIRSLSVYASVGIMALLVSIVLPSLAQAQDDDAVADLFAQFGYFTPGSDLAIDHSVWNDVLGATVISAEAASKSATGGGGRASTGTKIARGSRKPSREEGNRVLFHLLEDGHVDLVQKYRQELELLPDYYPLKDFDADEQLAYWLNLHNAALYEQLARRYPLSKLKTLRNGKKGRPSLWDEKFLNVQGVALSLNDIQNNILIRHWKSPMVLYGLYHGAIGGPNLPSQAFTGDNVQAKLAVAAREFVNSRRGVRAGRGKVRVSMLYEWGEAAFPNGSADLSKHLAQFASNDLTEEIAGAEDFNANLYDWSIADTKGGVLSAGPALSTSASLLNATTGAIPGGSSMLTRLGSSNSIVPGRLKVRTLDQMEKDKRDEEPEKNGEGQPDED